MQIPLKSLNQFSLKNQELKTIAKKLIKKILGEGAYKYFFKIYRTYIFNKKEKRFKNLSSEEIFSIIYKEKLWSPNSDLKFNSGPGSHKEFVVSEYTKRVNKFLEGKRLTVVDFGCGDFNVGKHLVRNCQNYIGVDIVEDLIKFNSQQYSSNKVQFKKINVFEDELPKGDLILIKEVLQHLPNSEIKEVLNKLRGFKYILVTENIPPTNPKPNIDKNKGPLSRSYLNSYIDISLPPFNFHYITKETLISMPRNDSKGTLTTILYTTY